MLNRHIKGVGILESLGPIVIDFFQGAGTAVGVIGNRDILVPGLSRSIIQVDIACGRLAGLNISGIAAAVIQLCRGNRNARNAITRMLVLICRLFCTRVICKVNFTGSLGADDPGAAGCGIEVAVYSCLTVDIHDTVGGGCRSVGSAARDINNRCNILTAMNKLLPVPFRRVIDKRFHSGGNFQFRPLVDIDFHAGKQRYLLVQQNFTGVGSDCHIVGNR